MPKLSAAITRLPPQTQNALIDLGAHLAVARIRRKESQRTWAKRIGITVPTLMKLESGDPGVSIGAYASALWLLGRDGELSKLADPVLDKGAMELDIREAEQLGRSRATRARTAALKRAQNKKTSA